MNKIEISTKTILQFLAIILGLWLFYLLREIAVLLFVVVIIVTALEPAVSWGTKYKIPRAVSAVAIYLFLLALLSLIIYLIIPPLVLEIKNFASTLPGYSSQFNFIYELVSNSSDYWRSHIDTISQQLSNLSGGVYNATIALFGGLTSALTVLVLSFYSLVDKEGLNQFLLSFVAAKNQPTVVKITSQIASKLGKWLRGQIVISLTMGLTVFLLLFIAGIPFALTIGVTAAVLEVIPIVGAVVTGILAVGVSLLYGSWMKALLILAIYLAIQQLESNYLIPKIMSKAVGLYPAVIIVALLVGSALGGLVGAILAIPLITTLIVTIRALQKHS